MSDLGLSTCDKISVVKSARSSDLQQSLCEDTDCVRYQHQHLSGAARLPGRRQQHLLLTSTPFTTSVTSTCLVVMLDSLQAGVQATMRKICQGRKKCLALWVISQARLDSGEKSLT